MGTSLDHLIRNTPDFLVSASSRDILFCLVVEVAGDGSICGRFERGLR